MECSEGERQYGEGSKRELVPQRDRNSVVKEKPFVDGVGTDWCQQPYGLLTPDSRPPLELQHPHAADVYMHYGNHRIRTILL
jgi:hypothetical protein